MKSFLDTTVLVAAVFPHHVHHPPSFQLLQRCRKPESFCSLHSLAEAFHVLTSYPAPYRVGAEQVLLYLGSVRERLTAIALDESDYMKALETATSIGLTGGAVFDLLLGQAAVKARAQVIYTWNVRHFSRIPDTAARVRTPE